MNFHNEKIKLCKTLVKKIYNEDIDIKGPYCDKLVVTDACYFIASGKSVSAGQTFWVEKIKRKNKLTYKDALAVLSEFSFNIYRKTEIKKILEEVEPGLYRPGTTITSYTDYFIRYNFPYPTIIKNSLDGFNIRYRGVNTFEYFNNCTTETQFRRWLSNKNLGKIRAFLTIKFGLKYTESINKDNNIVFNINF